MPIHRISDNKQPIHLRCNELHLLHDPEQDMYLLVDEAGATDETKYLTSLFSINDLETIKTMIEIILEDAAK